VPGEEIVGDWELEVTSSGDSDPLDLKEYEGIRIVSPRVFLDILVA
jgi:hypothetical protein